MAAGATLSSEAALAAPLELTVYKTPWCGCCKGWIAHMARAGFRPNVVEQRDQEPVRAPPEILRRHRGPHD